MRERIGFGRYTGNEVFRLIAAGFPWQEEVIRADGETPKNGKGQDCAFYGAVHGCLAEDA